MIPSFSGVLFALFTPLRKWCEGGAKGANLLAVAEGRRATATLLSGPGGLTAIRQLEIGGRLT